MASGDDKQKNAVSIPNASLDSAWRGIRAFKNARYEEALPYLSAAALANHVESCLLLSRMYFAGHGVDKDHSRYVYWLARAADLGDRAARSKLKRLMDDAEQRAVIREDAAVVDLLQRLPGFET